MSEALVWRRFEELTLDELYDALALRAEVFVAEQRSPYLDVDGRDRGALHLLALGGEEGLVGYLRILPPPGPHGAARIGRLVCAPAARGRGLARRMMTAALGRIAESWPQATVALAAQTQIAAFYESFGFRRVGDAYDEEGVRHCDMVLLAPAAGP